MYYKGKPKHSKPARELVPGSQRLSFAERLSKHRGLAFMTASCFTVAVVIAIAFGFGADATNPLLHESAVKAASDRMEAQLHGYTTPAPTSASNTGSAAMAKHSKKVPTFSAPKGIAEGNKVIAQASVSVGGGTVYDAEKRIVKLVETRAGVVTSTKQFVWAGDQLCEERDASGAVTRRFFDMGEQIAGTNYYYTRDQIGSVREMTNGSGAVQSQYGYGPWGEVSKLAGTGPDSDMQYAGMYFHQPSGLNLAVNRAYSPSQGRFISRDPIDDLAFGMNPTSPEPTDPGIMAMTGTGQAMVNPNALTIRGVSSDPRVRTQIARMMTGQNGPPVSRTVNPYTYVSNNPISYTDPSGLFIGRPQRPPDKPPTVCPATGNDLYDQCVKNCQRQNAGDAQAIANCIWLICRQYL